MTPRIFKHEAEGSHARHFPVVEISVEACRVVEHVLYGRHFGHVPACRTMMKCGILVTQQLDQLGVLDGSFSE